MNLVTEEEKKLIKDFLNRVDSKYRKELCEYDAIRFLKARKWDIEAALVMANNWGTWWNTVCSEATGVTPKTVLHGIVDPFEHVYRELCPITHFGEDKTGCPIYWEQSGYISGNFSLLAEKISLDEMLNRHIRNQELAVCRMHHLSIKYGKKIEQQIIVFNLSNLTYSLDTRALSVFRKLISTDQDNYPERLKKFFVINAPWYFTAIWAVVSPWIDPVTRDKMLIIGSDYMEALREYIDDSQIPVELGGANTNVSWQWPYPEETLCTPSHIEEYNLHRSKKESDCGRTPDNVEVEGGGVEGGGIETEGSAGEVVDVEDNVQSESS